MVSASDCLWFSDVAFLRDGSAIVDEGVQIGESTRAWHLSYICAKARIGGCCSLGQGVFVGNDVVIGDNVRIQNNVSVYDGVTLEDDVFCGPSMVFTNVYNPRSAVARKDEYRRTLIRRGATLGGKLHGGLRRDSGSACIRWGGGPWCKETYPRLP